MTTLLSIWNIKEIRNKVFYSLIIIVIYRLGSHIPISGIDLAALNNMFNNGGVLGFFNLFSGGGLERYSIFALGSSQITRNKAHEYFFHHCTVKMLSQTCQSATHTHTRLGSQPP